MKNILLVYSKGCPNYEPVKKILFEIGLPFKEIVQDNLHKGCVCKTLSSPTILVDDKIIVYGGKKDSQEIGWSKNMPDKKELKSLIELLV
jgi:glutaredoxin